MALQPELLHRFVCAKYLFLNGIDSLSRGGPYAAGLAVLSFQDAVEMMLRTIAEHFHSSIKDNAAFSQVLDEVEKVIPQHLTHRSALLQLNASRVKFKHLGLEPRIEDARKFRNDLEGFFPGVLKATVGLSFDELSLANLIRHRRTVNWLHKAERHFSAADYENSIEASAVAFAIFRWSRGTERRDLRLEHALHGHRSARSNDNFDLHALGPLVEEIDKRLIKFQEQLDWLSSGVEYDQLRRFEDLTPTVNLSVAGLLYFSDYRPRGIDTCDNALFCLSFATKTILMLQNVYRSDTWRAFELPPISRFLIIKKGAIVVWPDDKSGEEIRVVEPGEELLGYRHESDNPNYVAIIQDGGCAYISAECVEKICQL